MFSPLGQRRGLVREDNDENWYHMHVESCLEDIACIESMLVCAFMNGVVTHDWCCYS